MALAQNLENPTVQHLKPLVSDDSLAWRNLVSTPFWQQIPAWADVDEELFLEHK